MALWISSLTRTSQYLVPQRDLRHLPHIEHAVYAKHRHVQAVSVRCSQSPDDWLPGLPGRHAHEPAGEELQLPRRLENAVQSRACHLERRKIIVAIQLNERMTDRPADALELVDRDVSPRRHEHDARHARSVLDGNERRIALRHFQQHNILKPRIHTSLHVKQKSGSLARPLFAFHQYETSESRASGRHVAQLLVTFMTLR